MTLRTPSRRIRTPSPIRTVRVDDFRGGVDLRQRAERSPWALNVTSDGRNLVKRWGASHKSTLATAATWIGYSVATKDLLVLRGNVVYAYDVDANGQLSNVRTVYDFGSPIFASVADLGGYAWISAGQGSPKVVRWDGTNASLATSSAGGGPIVAWQNKLWTLSAYGSNKLMWSAAGDGMTWNTTTDYVFIREPDDAPIYALGSGQGIDVVGREGLIVFKGHSYHRVIDSETGEYVTLETQQGVTGGPEAATTVDGIVYFANNVGIWVATEEGARKISDPIDSLWNRGLNQYLVGTYYETVAWQQHGRVYFTHDGLGLILEYDPRNDAWWVHELMDGVTVREVLSAATQVLDGSGIESTYVLDSAGTKVLRFWDQSGQGGTMPEIDDYTSTAISAEYVTPMIDFGFDPMQVQRVLVEGWGTAVTVKARKDGNIAGTTIGTAALMSGFSPGTDLLGHAALHGFGHCRTLALEFAEASATVMVFTDETNTSHNRPNFGLTAVRVDAVPLR